MGKKTKPQKKDTPAFDADKAKSCTPWRHEPTARTVSFIQPASGSEAHLFTATRLFVATEQLKNLPPALAPQQSPEAKPAPAQADAKPSH